MTRTQISKTHTPKTNLSPLSQISAPMATTDSVSIVDLRFLSQSEINSLALSSPNAFNLDTLSDVVPKIDRSIFNESAGSRKQTYSRLPLFQSQSQSQPQIPQIPQPQPQSQPPNPALPRRRGRPRLHPLPAPASAPAPGHAEDPAPPDLGREENLQIVCILKKLFESRDKCSSNSNNNSNKIKNNNRSIVVFSEVNRDREVRNGKGVAVDLAALAGTEDLFGEEIRRRTDGLRTEDQLLGYMTGLDGQWGSRRKKRKVVDAAVLGDSLPKGWKVLLGLKRKEGIVYLNCRRYVSPSGKQFMSCKEVSSYIISLNGQQDAGQPFSCQHDNHASSMDRLTPGSVTGRIPQDDNRKEEMANCSFVAPISYVSTEYERQVRLFGVRKQAMSESDNSLECHECNITFSDKDACFQHLSAFHQRSAKRRKLGKSLTDGVIVKDGKYECQFCHKTFTERHRYNGHIGAHIRYEGLSVDASPHNITTRTSDNSSSLAIVPVVSLGLNISANISEKTYVTKSVNDQNHIDPPLYTREADMNASKDSPKADAPEITGAISGNCKKEIECTVGAPEITEVVSSENTIQHIPKEGTYEIAEAVSSENKIEDDPKAGTPKFTEAFSGDNKIEHDPKEGAPEITEVVPSRKFVDSQSEDWKIIYEESKELIMTQNVTDITSNACTDVITPCGPDVNNVAHACSPIILEPTTSESIHEQINSCEIAGDKSGVIEDINAQDGKPNVCLDSIASTLAGDATTSKTNSEAGKSSSKSRNMNGSIDDRMMVDYESENGADTSNAMSIELAEEIGHFSSEGEFDGGQINQCETTGYKSEVVDTKDAMSIEDNACMDTSSPSLINVDKTSYENPNTIDPSLCTVISAVENCNGDEKLYEEHHLLSLSGNGLSYGVETYASDIFTSKGEENGELDTSIHDKSDVGSCQALTNKDTGIASAIHNELNTGYIFTDIASEPTSGIETNADCMFPGDLKKSLLEGIDGVGNELQNYFHSSNACDEGAAGIIMSNGDEGPGLQVNVADQSSSWVQSSNSLPILDLIPDQCQDELRGTVARNEQANLSDFGELRLGSIEPAADFVLFAGQSSGTSGSVTRSPMKLFPDDQLEWGMSLNKMVTPSVRTSVCVWCSREFRLEGVESEPQSESLGYMCPDCKLKISGQLGLLNNGFS